MIFMIVRVQGSRNFGEFAKEIRAINYQSLRSAYRQFLKFPAVFRQLLSSVEIDILLLSDLK